MQESRHQALAAGDADDGKAKTIGSSQGGAVDASSAPARRAGSETIGSPRGGKVDASSAPAEKAENDLSAASTFDQGNAEISPAVLPGREQDKLSDWGRPPVAVQGRTTRGQSRRLEGANSRGWTPRSRTCCLRQRTSGPNLGVS